MAEGPCLVNRAILDALRDAEDAYAARGIRLVPALDATHPISTHDLLLYRSIYTIFRGLPARLAPGTSLHVTTVDRAGGDIELSWEAREDPTATPSVPDPDPRILLRHGPYGDLLEVALRGLDELCRVRTATSEPDEQAHGPSDTPLDLAPGVRRRFSFIIPSLDRGGWGDRLPGPDPPR